MVFCSYIGVILLFRVNAFYVGKVFALLSGSYVGMASMVAVPNPAGYVVEADLFIQRPDFVPLIEI